MRGQADLRAGQVRPFADAGQARGEDLVPSRMQRPADLAEAVRAAPRAVHQNEDRHRPHLLKPCRAWWLSFALSLAQLCCRSYARLGTGPITSGSDHTACMPSKSAAVNGRMINRLVVIGRHTFAC